jgi:hypothetical protein
MKSDDCKKNQAPLICIKCAADDGVEFDVADALALVVAQIGESLVGLDQLELAVNTEKLT